VYIGRVTKLNVSAYLLLKKSIKIFVQRPGIPAFIRDKPLSRSSTRTPGHRLGKGSFEENNDMQINGYERKCNNVQDNREWTFWAFKKGKKDI
jgi:hypothetical protein